MLISLNWIRDFVDVPELPPQELGKAITLATAEVDNVLSPGSHLKTIVVAEVLETRPHPKADKLKLVKFKLAGGVTKECVCGAPNVRATLKVAYAPIGTIMPNGLVLEPKKIRDVLSDGMICSKAELGIGDDHDGIWELPQETEIGKSIGEVLGSSNDVVIEFDNKSLTHRPDLWGHYGMAREFSTIFKSALKNPFDAEWRNSITKLFTKDPSPIIPEVESDTTCLGYFGISIDGIEVAESPDWIKERLIASGLRPINNMVDIGNYVMLELGIPLHIFDRNKIANNKIRVERLKKETRIKVLTGQEVTLLAGDTVITDAKGPLVIAGIVGGEESGVSENTKNIFIETANWKAGETRKLATRIGIRTDSLQRYEKSLDSLLLERTILRAASLVHKLYPTAKIVGKLEYAGPDLKAIKPLSIKTSAVRIAKRLGTEVSEKRVTEILESLDFKVIKKGEELDVLVPSYRATKDIEFEADLIEEVGRIIGYDNIQPTSPVGGILPIRLPVAVALNRKIQDFCTLTARSLEIQTYPLVNADLLKRAEWHELNESLKLQNPLSEESDRMRPSLIPSLLEATALNQKTYEKFSLFEIGRAYLSDAKNYSTERNQLGFVIFDRKNSVFLEAINLIEKLISFIGIPAQIINPDPKLKNPIVPSEWSGNHPIECQWIKLMGKNAGAIVTVHPALLSNYKIKGNLTLAIIDFTDSISQALSQKAKYTPISKYPASFFDCTVVADEKNTVGSILDVINKLKIKEILDTKIVGVFPLPEEKKAVTLRFTFGDKDQTLSAERIKEMENTVLGSLDKAGYRLR